MEKEKDEKIKELEIKINSMGLAYENVLNVSSFFLIILERLQYVMCAAKTCLLISLLLPHLLL